MSRTVGAEIASCEAPAQQSRSGPGMWTVMAAARGTVLADAERGGIRS